MKEGLEQLVMNNEEDESDFGSNERGKTKQSAMSTEEVRKLFELKNTDFFY